MKKLAWLALGILVFLAVFITTVIVNEDIRVALGEAIDGSVVEPGVDFIETSFIGIGTSGFWYIAAYTLVQWILGCFIGVVIVYGLLYKKVWQEKIKHISTAKETAPAFQNQPSKTIPITGLQNEPTPTPAPVAKSEVKEEKVTA